MPAIVQVQIQSLYFNGVDMAPFWAPDNNDNYIAALGHPGVFSNISPVSIWEAEVDGPGNPLAQFYFWYRRLDIPSYAPTLAVLAIPLLSRLDDLVTKEFADFQLRKTIPVGDPRMDPRRVEFDPILSERGKYMFELAAIFFRLKDGIMKLVAEFPDAPPLRQAVITDLLANVTGFVATSDVKELCGAIDTTGRDEQGPWPPPLLFIRPIPVGFSPLHTTLIGNALDWIEVNFHLIFADRPMEVSPILENLDRTGHTSYWTGNVEISLEHFARVNPVAELIDTLVHELLHARPDLLGRIWQSAKIGFFKDESEHSFLQNAGMAAKAQFLGFPSLVDKRLVIDNITCVTVLLNQDGTLFMGLPPGGVLQSFLNTAINIAMRQP